MALPVFLAAAAAAGSQTGAPSQAIDLRQATATVRIVAGERITAAQIPASALVRRIELHGADGSERPAMLVEFP